MQGDELRVATVDIAYIATSSAYIVAYMLLVGRDRGPYITLVLSVRREDSGLAVDGEHELLLTDRHHRCQFTFVVVEATGDHLTFVDSHDGVTLSLLRTERCMSCERRSLS